MTDNVTTKEAKLRMQIALQYADRILELEAEVARIKARNEFNLQHQRAFYEKRFEDMRKWLVSVAEPHISRNEYEQGLRIITNGEVKALGNDTEKAHTWQQELATVVEWLSSNDR